MSELKVKDNFAQRKANFMAGLRLRNKIRQQGRPYLDLIRLECGIEVWIDRTSKDRCECGEDIWWAITDKNKRPMPINSVGFGLLKFDTHFATCPLADEKRKKK